MTELPADLQTLKLELLDGVRCYMQRRRRRTRALRSVVISLAATGILAASALAAGDALGIIHLGEGVHAVHVAGYPAYDVQTKKIVLAGKGRFVYHITGGHSHATGCSHPTDVYVTSTQTLSPTELRAAVNAANGINSKEEAARIKGLKSLSTTCGHPGIEAIIGVKPPASNERPQPVIVYGNRHGDKRAR